MAAAPPNILYIMSDDHTSQASGAYGGILAPLSPTPTIDKLAGEGTLFENVFCVNSICSPSRANIMTGQQCQRNGVLDLYDGLPVERQHLSREMGKAGYATAMIGKWHLKADPDSFDYYCVLPGQGQYFDPVFYTNSGGTPGEVHLDSTCSKPANILQFEGHSTDITTDTALEWLDNKRPRDRPFFCMLHYKAPHDMFDHHPRYDDYLEEVDIPEPDNMQGRSFAGALRGEDKPGDWRTATYYRYWMHMAHGHNNPAHFGVRTERYKLIFFYGCDFTDVLAGEKRTDRGGNRYYPNTPAAWELYDLANDPHEMTNVYGKPEYATVVAELKAQLLALREELDETDTAYPHIQEIIDRHWNDRG